MVVDQVEHPVEALVISSLFSQEGSIDEVQQTQKVEDQCSNVTFSAHSPYDNETLVLNPAEGPYGNSDFRLYM